MDVALSIASIAIGIIGLAYGLYENRLRARARDVQRLWGETVCDSLATVNEQVLDLKEKCRMINNPTSSFTADHLATSLGNIGDHLSNAKKSVHNLISLATDRERPEGVDRNVGRT